MPVQEATIQIMTELKPKVPVTIEHLSCVTSVVKLRGPDKTALLIEADPSTEEEECVVLNLFDGFEGMKDISDGGVLVIIKILEGISGKEFVLVKDEPFKELHYRR